MEEKFERSGYFWFPEIKSDKTNKNCLLSGSLIFDPLKGVELNLLDEFSFEEWTNKEKFEKINIINGIDNKGTLFTLLNCKPHSKSHFININFKNTIFECEFLIEGYTFNSIEYINFNEIMVNFYSINNWINLSGFKDPVLDYKDTNHINSLKLEYVKPEDVLVMNGNDTEIAFTFKLGGIIFTVNTTNEYTYSQNSPLIIKKTVKNHFFDYLKELENVTSFFEIPFQSKIILKNFWGIVNDGHIHYVKIYFKLSYKEYQIEEIESKNMLFLYDDISDKLLEYYKQFNENYNKLSTIVNHYKSVFYSKYLNIEQEFLTYIQCVDGILEFEIKRNRKQKGKQKLPHNLESKIEEEFNKFDFIFRTRVKDYQKSAEKITLTRHYFSHRFIEQEKLAAKGKILIYLTKITKILLEVLLFSNFGFDDDHIKKIIDRKYNFKIKS